jgi:sodium-dependent dicarboxylate transporter 2/3/5
MRNGRWIGLGMGLAMLFVFLLLPPFEPLTALGMKTLGIFLATIIWWATVGIDYPSILCLALFALTGVMTPEKIFAASMGNWVVIFLIGCFGLCEGLRVTGFSRRFAMWFITRPFVAGHPWRLVAMFLLSCFLMGTVMSATVTTMVFMAIAVPMLENLGYKKGDPFAAMLMMGIAWAATASMGTTPFAHAGNLIMISWLQRDFGYQMGFHQYIMFGLPLGLLVFALVLGAFRYIVRPDVRKIANVTTSYIRETAGKMQAMKLEEKLALGIFLAVVVVWLLPGLTRGTELAAYLDKIGFAVPALVGAFLLCVIRVKNRPILDFRQWMLQGIEWGTVFLVAAIMAMGAAIGDPETGIPQLLTRVFEPLATGMPLYGFLLIILLVLVVQTNLMSNVVSMTVAYTIVAPLAATTNLGNPVALGVLIAAVSNYAFSLPSATTSTAIMVGSGWVPVPFMLRYGLVMIIPVVLVSVFVGYPLASFVFG